MTDINTVCVTGRVIRDLGERDFTYTPAGTAKARFTIAVNKSVKNASGGWDEKTAFFDIVVWGKYAEGLRPHLAKGKKVSVHGRLEQDTWEDKQTRAKREKIYITADNVQVEKAAQASGGQATWTGLQAAPQPAGNIGDNTGEPAEFEDDWPPF